MKIAIYGAAGFTGRLIAAELFRRGVPTLLLGRNEEALKQIPNAGEIRAMSLEDTSALIEALTGCDVVISSVAPYTKFGKPVLEAAMKAGCNYVDVTGEQGWIREVHETFHEPATSAGITVLPAATDDGIPGDLIGNLVAKNLPDVDVLKLHHGYFNPTLSRGSVRSFKEITDNAPLIWENGKWQTSTIESVSEVDFPEGDGIQPSWRVAGPELIGIVRHVKARKIEATVNVDLVAGVSNLTEEIIESMPIDQTEESHIASRFTILAEAFSKSGQKSRGFVFGSDIYNSTAVIAVEAAIRLVNNEVPKGVVSPSEAFKPMDFLNALKSNGIKWKLES